MRKSLSSTSAAACASALIAALAVAGCGSSAPTKSQYIAKADTICTTASAQTAPLIHQVTEAAVALGTGKASSVPQLASAITRLHEVAKTYLTQLEKLEQPSGEHAQIERFLTPFASVVSAIGQAASALQKGQAQQALGILEQVRPASQQATAGAQAYGATSCETVLAALG